MPIKFAVKIVRPKVYIMTITSPMTLTSFKVTSASETWLLFNLQYLRQYLSITFKRDMTVDLWDALSAHARFDDLDARSQRIGKCKRINVACSRQLRKQAISIKLANNYNNTNNVHFLCTTVSHFLRDLGFANVYLACPAWLLSFWSSLSYVCFHSWVLDGFMYWLVQWTWWGWCTLV